MEEGTQAIFLFSLTHKMHNTICKQQGNDTASW